MRYQLPLFRRAVVLGVALTASHHDATGIGRGHRAELAAADQQVTIQHLDAAGTRTLLGCHGGSQRPLALYLFYTDCQPCTDRLGEIRRLYDEYRDKGLDVALVSIAPMDDRPKLLDVLEHINSHIPTFLLDKMDHDFAEEFFLRDWEPVVPSVCFTAHAAS